ncbi:MAG: HD domain-containing protein [Lachnospiraceae bacterium]|nr:HD domain-containing protein [Lachnospiraceae bacterium]
MFTPSLAVLVILFSMETPDYQLLMKTLAELDDLRKNLQIEVKKQTKKVEDRREKVERLSEQVILTLAKTIDAKDKYTNGHSERVAAYSREIAKRMGMSEQEQHEIYHMGILHDIGKIGVSDDITNKLGKLTDDEYRMIQKQPEIGGEILAIISELPDISIGAKYHHEKYDGTGYPYKIAGEDIPFYARIIRIADAYDAMTSRRSYRDVLPQQVVRAEIF